MIQAVIGPFSSSFFNLNFYGVRYLYRFIKSEEQTIDPYLFGSLGLTTFSYDVLGDKESSSFFSYGLGGGAELILGNAFGLSAEVGYGKILVIDNVGVAGIVFGLGLHYYIK